MQNHIKYIQNLIDQGCPRPEEYEKLNNVFRFIHDRIQDGDLSREEVRNLWKKFAPVFSCNTMQGFALQKPHGYAGDFEIIDRIYQKWLSPDPKLVNWDHFFHWQCASRNTRNRKKFFIDKFSELARENGRNYQVLNVGSGPARDVKEFFDKNPTSKITFHCLDMDKNAIAYAKDICCELTQEQVIFDNVNVFRYKNKRDFDIIWSAGLFDYLDKKKFTFLLGRLLTMLKPDGRLIIGNYSLKNDSRAYMEFGEWYLNYRSPEELKEMALDCGVKTENIKVEQGVEGVNLFLVVEK